MKMTRRPALFGLACAAILFFASPSLAEPSAKKGQIAFDETYFDFGKVTEGDVIKHTFSFKNKGKGPFKMVKVETSCGCTTTEGVLKEYAPGESGTMTVTIDTRGKHGITVKTVRFTLENATEDKPELTLSAQLVPPPHPEATNGGLATTDAKCKTCHLDSGVGEKGIYLYHRICSQCHGSKGAGASAGAFNDPAWQERATDASIREILEKGAPEKGMPSYVEGVSPPLTGEQLDSLITYMRSLVQKGG
jgi:mono/diheme cytochrome c family protein